MPPVLGMQSLNPWTTKEVPAYCLLISFISLCIGDLNFYTYRKFIGFFIFAKCFLRSQLSPCLLKSMFTGAFMVVQWLKFHPLVQGVWVRSLVGKLRSHRLPPKKQKQKKPHKIEAINSVTNSVKAE